MAIGRDELLTKSFALGTTGLPYRIAVTTANPDIVNQATAATQVPIGILNIPVSYDQPVKYGQAPPTLTAMIGETADVVIAGSFPVEYGAAVVVGDRLMSDAQGRAIPVPASPTAGTWQLGIATAAGGAGTIGCCLISRQRY